LADILDDFLAITIALVLAVLILWTIAILLPIVLVVALTYLIYKYLKRTVFQDA